MDRVLVDLPCKRLQVDEIWSYVYSKAKNVPPEKVGEAGDVWTWVALDADTKLVPSYLVGGRGPQECRQFVDDLARRMADRIQLSSDGFRLYLTAVERAFGSEIDYAMIVKLYTAESSGYYSPPKCIGTESTIITGDPDEGHITSLRRAPEPHDENEHAPVHPSDQRVLQEGGEPRRRRQLALPPLQLCSASQEPEQSLPNDTRHGSGGG